MHFISDIEKDTSIGADANVTEVHEFIDDKIVNLYDTTVKRLQICIFNQL